MKEKEGKEIPIGLAMKLALNEYAMEYYSELDEVTKDKITNFVQGGNDGWETKDRINQAVKEMAERKTDFLESKSTSIIIGFAYVISC